MVASTDAQSDQTPDQKPERPVTGSVPPLLDLSHQTELAPGPLTKPAPVIRPPKTRTRWLIPVIVIVVLAAAAGIAVSWQAGLGG